MKYFWCALVGALCSLISVNAAPALPDLDRRDGTIPKADQINAEAAQAEARLRERVPGLTIERHGITGSPRWIATLDNFLTGKVGPAEAANPRSIVKAFVEKHATVFGHSSLALDEANLIREYTNEHSGLHTLVWKQKHADIPVFDAVFQAHVTREGELVNVSSQFVPGLNEAGQKAGVANPRLSAENALALAARHLDEPANAADVVPASEASGAERKRQLRAPFLRGHAQARLTWLPMDGATLRLCWDIALKVRSRQEVYRVLLDADSGEVLVRRCQTSDISNASYRVFTGDSPTPLTPSYNAPGNANQPATVSRTLVTLSALNTNASPIGWINDGVNETKGNNVDASTDTDGDDVLDLPRPQGSPNRVFDFSLDLNQEPGTYKKAAVVNLFYWCNWVHDKLYELGFNEAAGNFQANNFGKGGLGGDAIRADAQDGESINNANFNVVDPSDGEDAWIQMYLWPDPTPDRDGDFDNQVIIHEYVHGLSTRLVGAGVGLSGPQPGGLGEGWSDFYALALMSTAGEDLAGTYAFGAYAVKYYDKDYGFDAGGDNYYFGIRRYPYSTDTLKSPLTFKDIDPAQFKKRPGVPESQLWVFLSAAEVHAVGEIWCATLWDARANLISKLGFATGNQLMLQYVTDGMKLAPANPTFVQARDAILQAEQVLSGGTNKAALWAAFAKRGLGSSAVAPAYTTTSGVIEDFNPNDPLRVGLPGMQTITGPHGGTFAPGLIAYGITNTGGSSMAWNVTAQSPLNASPLSGTLAGADGDASVSITFNAAGAGALPIGTHTRSIVFSNHHTAVTQTRLVTFVVTQSLVVAGTPIHVAGPAGGPFAAFTANLKLTNRSSASLHWAANVQAPFQLSPSSGTLAGGGNATLNVSLNTSLAAALPMGSYSNLIAISNLTASTVLTQNVSVAAAARDYAEYFDNEIPIHVTNIMISFVPNDAGYLVCRQPASVFPTDPAGGTIMPKDNLNGFLDSMEVALSDGKQVTLFGESANHLFVNFNGSLSLDKGDGYVDEDHMLNRHFSKRRVSGLMAENWVYYDNSKVSWKQLDDRFVATFEEVYVAHYPLPDGYHDFQIEWFFDGLIRVTILQASSGPAVVGLSRGHDLPFLESLNFDFIPEDFIASPSCADISFGALKISLPATVTEGNGVLVGAGKVILPGARAADLTVSLSSSDTTEITVPANVIVPAGATSAVFNITVVNDGALDGTRNATITATAPLYSAGAKTLEVNDNESTTLRMALPMFITEGHEATAWLWTEAPVANDVFVFLSSTNGSGIVFSAFLPYAVIPAGATSTVFQYKAVDDFAITGTRYATITASVANWTAATNGMLILDNESTNLTVVLPFFMSEGDDIVTNAGEVRISGTLPTNLVVNLSASGGSLFEMLAFGPVTIPAGKTNAFFDILVLDDNLVEPLEFFQITASAPGFGNGVSGILVIDNDGPPDALNPSPPHLAEGVPLDADLSWSKVEGELLVNGGFEDATLSGWKTFDSGGGSWLSVNSSYDPPGPAPSQTPHSGSRFALSHQFGNGRHELGQEIAIPEGVSNVVLSWSHRLKNFAPQWSSNQQFRVEVRDTANNVLATPFSTQPGDALTSDWTNRSASLNYYKGQTVRIVFIETDEPGTLSVSIDDVSVFATPPAPTTWLVYLSVNPTPDGTGFLGTTTNTFWTLIPLPTNTTFYWYVKSVRGGATNMGPIWQFTTAATTNRPPSLTMRYPGNLAVFSYPSTVTCSLNSLTDDGTVSKVEFWADGVKLGEVSVAPQTYDWVKPTIGDHVLWAVAQDSFGARGTSAVQRISVVPTNGILQTVVPFGSIWSYYDAGVNLGTAWRSNSYSPPTRWGTGPAQFGYGEGDEATTVRFGNDPNNKYITTYFRRSFAAPSDAQWFQMRVLRDDGVAVYFNGREVLRNNLASGAAYNTFATTDINLANEAALISTTFSPTNAMGHGLNLLAVEVHQSTASSVDLSFDLELAAVLNPKPTVTLTSPTAGASFAAPVNVPLSAIAFDPYGAVSNIIFFVDGAPLATSSVSPYTFSWSNAPAGLHTLRAVAKDIDGATNVSANLTIDIVAPPIITAQPTNQSVYPGGTGSFVVAVSGAAPLSFQWRKDTTLITTLIENATNAMLVLSNVQPSDAGDYVVRVLNSVGSIDSAPATLAVKPLPALGVTYGGSRIVLAWPEDAAAFHVESTTNLVSPVTWTPIPFGASMQNGQWIIILPVDATPQQFFRLQTP